jgi:hypothetical protein
MHQDPVVLFHHPFHDRPRPPLRCLPHPRSPCSHRPSPRCKSGPAFKIVLVLAYRISKNSTQGWLKGACPTALVRKMPVGPTLLSEGAHRHPAIQLVTTSLAITPEQVASLRFATVAICRKKDTIRPRIPCPARRSDQHAAREKLLTAWNITLHILRDL